MNLLSVSFGVFFWHTMAILCVFFLLKKFAFRIMLDILEQRTKKINDSIINAQQIEQEKQNIEILKQDQIKFLSDQKIQMLSEIKTMRENLLSQTKNEVQTIKEDLISKATEEIENKKIQMQNQYSAQLALMAIKISEQLINKELSSENKQTSLISDIVDGLNKSHNKNA